MLEQCHDLVYDLLSATETAQPPAESASLLQYLTTLSSEAKDFTQAEYEQLQKHVSEGVGSLRNLVGKVGTETKSSIGQALSRGFEYLHSYFVSSASISDLVDPKLNDVQQVF